MARPYIAPTIADTASVASPGAGGGIVQITNLPRGWYEVLITICLDGTAETDKDNLRLVRSVPAVGTLVVDLPSISAQVVQVKHILEVTDPTDDLEVEAVNAATAGAIYTVHLAANRLS